MKITCESCGAKYTIADDKVRGRKVKIRCKGCGTPIVVDGQQTSSPSNGEAATAETESAVSVEAPASIVPEAEWSVNLSDTEQLSLSTAQIVEAWQTGKLTADAFVWKDGMGDWLPILECPDLAPLLTAPRAGLPAPEPETAAAASIGPSNAGAARTEAAKSVRPATRAIKPSGAAARSNAAAARVTGGRAQGAQDLFAGVERAGADEEEVQTSAPVLPQAGGKGQDEKATGARNENSVLFSLDALKAGFAGPTKSDTPAKPVTNQASDDPFGMASAPAAASLGARGSLFSFADNQALLTAPPPPDPPPQRVAPAAMAAGGFASAAPPPSQKRLIVFGAIGVGILVVGLALGVGLAGNKGGDGDKDKATAETATGSDEKIASKTKTEEPKEEAKKEEPKPAEEAKKEEPEKAPAAQEPEKTEVKAEPSPKAPATTPAGTPGGVKPVTAKEPKDEPKPPADVQPFSKGAAVAALSAASSSAASCKKIGGPTGTGKVTVTFAPSGRVTSANVNGPPFAGTAVGGCVASVFRRAKVPAFSGTQITVSKSFTIR